MTYIFEHRATRDRLTIKAADVYDAWTQLRVEHNHLDWFRIAGWCES